jgi:hypothetical protein
LSARPRLRWPSGDSSARSTCWSVEVPRPPSIWDSFIRVVFDGTLDSDLRGWQKKDDQIERKPKKAGFDDPEKASRLGRALVAYTQNDVVARQYVSELVESHIVMFVGQELQNELHSEPSG